MAGVAIYTTDIVAPVLTATEVVVFFLTRVTAKTRFGDFFRRFVFEGNDLLRIAFFDVGLAWTMTRFTTRNLLFPTSNLCKLSVRGV